MLNYYIVLTIIIIYDSQNNKFGLRLIDNLYIRIYILACELMTVVDVGWLGSNYSKSKAWNEEIDI